MKKLLELEKELRKAKEELEKFGSQGAPLGSSLGSSIAAGLGGGRPNTSKKESDDEDEDEIDKADVIDMKSRKVVHSDPKSEDSAPKKKAWDPSHAMNDELMENVKNRIKSQKSEPKKELIKALDNGQWSLEKSGYKGYNAVDNIRRKENNLVGESSPIQSMQNVKRYSKQGVNSLDTNVKKLKQKSRKQPVKTFSSEEIKEVESKRQLTKAEASHDEAPKKKTLIGQNDNIQVFHTKSSGSSDDSKPCHQFEVQKGGKQVGAMDAYATSHEDLEFDPGSGCRDRKDSLDASKIIQHHMKNEPSNYGMKLKKSEEISHLSNGQWLLEKSSDDFQLHGSSANFLAGPRKRAADKPQPRMPAREIDPASGAIIKEVSPEDQVKTATGKVSARQKEKEAAAAKRRQSYRAEGKLK